MTTIAALVPMRHSSERVPGKNYRPIAGKPLYYHIIETLLAVPEITVVVVDTDSPTILEALPAAFPQVRALVRPEHLRQGETPMNAVLLHTTSQVPADWYLQTHSTNPLLKPDTVSRAIRALQGSPEHDTLFSVTRMQTRLWAADGSPVNHDPDVLLRTQDLPPIFEENSCMYMFTRETLVRRGNRLGERPLMFEIPRTEAIDIDEEFDFRLAECLLFEQDDDLGERQGG